MGRAKVCFLLTAAGVLLADTTDVSFAGAADNLSADAVGEAPQDSERSGVPKTPPAVFQGARGSMI